MIYLLAFTVTAVLLYMGGRARGLLAIALTALGLFVPCLLAGVRDETVGTDVLTYAKWMCLDAQRMGFVAFMRREAGIAAVGWNLFTYLSVLVTGSLPGYLFCIELACILPVYAGLHRISKGWEWLGMLLWLLLEYAFTLNGMRQSVAMSLSFLGFSYLLEGLWRRHVFWVVVAMLFHQTAVIALLFVPVAALGTDGRRFRKFFGKLTGWAVVGAVGACGVACLALGPRAVLALSSLKESYSYQVSRLGEGGASVAGAYLLAVVVVTWAYARLAQVAGVRPGGAGHGSLVAVTCLVAGLGCAAWQLDCVTPTLGRVGYYGSALIPYLGPLLSRGGRRSWGSNALLLLLLVVYFVAMTLVLGKEGAWPYTSAILGIG